MSARPRVAAVMQPYFFPYAGYFRLVAAADVFVLLDDVQFPRRGWVHRNRLPGDDGELRWLTLPLQKAAFEARICDLRFPADAAARLGDEMRRFPCLRGSADPLVAQAEAIEGTPVDHLERLLHACCARLGLPLQTMRASSLGLDPALRAQERILAAVRAVGATAYVNAPGGVELYDPQVFAQAGVSLSFLPPWEGPFDSILSRLLGEPAEAIAGEIRRQLA